jgi:hypothetical protein
MATKSSVKDTRFQDHPTPEREGLRGRIRTCPPITASRGVLHEAWEPRFDGHNTWLSASNALAAGKAWQERNFCRPWINHWSAGYDLDVTRFVFYFHVSCTSAPLLFFLLPIILTCDGRMVDGWTGVITWKLLKSQQKIALLLQSISREDFLSRCSVHTRI